MCNELYDQLVPPKSDLYDQLVPRNEEKPVKSIFKSKTFWVNAMTTAVSALVFLQGSDLVAANPEVVAILGGAIGVVNILLRIITKDAVTL